MLVFLLIVGITLLVSAGFLFLGHVLISALSVNTKYETFGGLLNIPKSGVLPSPIILSEALSRVITRIESNQAKKQQFVALINELKCKVKEDEIESWAQQLLSIAVEKNWPAWATACLPGTHRLPLGDEKHSFSIVLSVFKDWFPANWIEESNEISQDQFAIRFKSEYEDYGLGLVRYFTQLQREIPYMNDRMMKGAVIADMGNIIEAYPANVADDIEARVESTRKELQVA
jgi:hypothetical protein